MVDNCGACHGVSQSPQFAVSDANQAYETVKTAKMIDFSNFENSRFLAKIDSNHNCGTEDECSALRTKLASAFEAIVNSAGDTGASGSPQSGARKISSAVERDHPVTRNSYYVYEAEKFANTDMINATDATPTTLIEYSRAKEEGNPLLQFVVNLEGDNEYYLWVKYKSTDTTDLNVTVDLAPLGGFGDKMKNTGDAWEWVVFNNADSLLNLGGSSSVVIQPAGPNVLIDKILLIPFEVEKPNLKRKVLSFDISGFTGSPGRIDVVAEENEKGYYMVGQPVLYTSVPLRLKKMRIFFNGENKTNESTFDLIDIETETGMTVLETAVQAIPFSEEGKSSSDEVSISFEVIETI